MVQAHVTSSKGEVLTLLSPDNNTENREPPYNLLLASNFTSREAPMFLKKNPLLLPIRYQRVQPTLRELVL